MKKAVALLLILVFLMTFVSVSFASSGKLTGLERAYDRAGSRSQGKAPEVLSGLLDRETDTKTLIVNKVGEGFIEINGAAYDLPYVGEHEEGFEVELKAIANEGWEFYAWTGENVSDVAGVLQEETTIIMDGDKNITAFFADESKDKYYINLNIVTFKGAEGEVVDLTGHPPYPPGFEIELQAVPSDPNNHAFTHWALKEGNPGNILDASLYFLDISNPHTIFIMPDFMVTLIAHFTTWTGWKAPGEFDYDHNDFGHIKDGGGYGITQHYWNISDLNKGETLDFDFYAYWIPDRFRVYYGNYGDWGNWGADTLVFDSGWVSRDPAMGDDPQLYPEGVSLHEDNDYYNVMQSDKITTLNAGKYEAMIVKEEGKDVLMVEVEGRDPGTLWQYIVDRGTEPPPGKFEIGDIVITTERLNLRKNHDIDSDVVWLMPHGNRMEVTGAPVPGDEHTWWPLEGFGRSGYAAETGLEKTETIPPFYFPTEGSLGWAHQEGHHRGIDIWTGDWPNKVSPPGNSIYLPYEGRLVDIWHQHGDLADHVLTFVHELDSKYSGQVPKLQIITRYFHLASEETAESYINPELEIGTVYPAGTYLGEQGNRKYDRTNGESVITHLHFDIREKRWEGDTVGGDYIDPSLYLGYEFNFQKADVLPKGSYFYPGSPGK